MNLRKQARGRGCQVRIPHVCNFNSETTVLAHYRLAGIRAWAKSQQEQAA